MEITRKEKDNILRWDGHKTGFYEVYYLKWNDAKSRTAAWIRYTLTSPSMSSLKPYCELWGIFFDVDDTRKNFAVKKRFPIYDLSWSTDKFHINIKDAFLDMNRCKGALIDDKLGNFMEWDLNISSDGDTYYYFPSERFYTGGFPKTKGLSPHVNARMTGTFKVNDKTFKLESVPGQQTHLWGKKHALRWAWGHCNSFDQNPDALWEGLDAQIRLGPIRSPHMGLFYLRLDGKDYFFNQPVDWFRNKTRWKLGRWKFTLKNSEIEVKGLVTCDYDQMVAVTYTDPDGELLWCNNSKIASIELDVMDSQGASIARLTSKNGCAAEFVDRVTYAKVPVRL